MIDFKKKTAKPEVARSRTQSRSSPTKTHKPGARVRLKLQLVLSSGNRIGPGKIQLLELIETEGSLSRAAKKMEISYRRAWLFAQQINAAFSEPAIATPEHGQGGASAKITDFGREIVSRFRELELAVNSSDNEILAWFEEHESKV